MHLESPQQLMEDLQIAQLVNVDVREGSNSPSNTTHKTKRVNIQAIRGILAALGPS